MSLSLTLQKYINTPTQDYFENLARESIKGRNDMNRLNESLQRRCDIELDYARNIDSVVQELDQNDGAVNLEKIIKIYCEELKNKAKEARASSFFIKDFLINKISLLAKEQTSAVKILTSEGRGLLTQLHQKKAIIENQISQLITSSQEYFSHQIQKYSQENLSSMTSQKRNDNTYKSDKLFRNQKELREKIKNQDENYQSYLSGFDLRLSKIIIDLQQHDIERSDVIKDVVSQLLPTEKLLAQVHTELSLYKYKDSYMKSFQIDYSETKNFVQESINKVEENWTENMAYFLKKCQDHQCDRNQITLNMEILKNNIVEINMLIKQHNQDLITSVQICQQAIHIEMQQLWASNQVNLHALINMLARSSVGRQIWIQEFSQFRIEKRFELSELSYQNTINLLSCILNICQEELDANTVRKLVLMTVTFYKIDKNEKIYLFEGIKEHKIFEQIDLWDAIFFESLYEEMKKQQYMRVNEDITDSMNREKNTIFGFSGSLIENMLSFGQSKQNTKQLIQKYCKLYLLSETHIKLLVSIIENWKGSR